MTPPLATHPVQCLSLQQFDNCLPQLAELLHACVHDGASIGFVLPFSPDDAEGFWLKRIRPSLAAGKRVVMIARIDHKLAGTVQLDCGLMPNQDHRADVSKLLVHPAFRRRGIARVLMAELEHQAVRRDRTLLVLDTRTGDSAEPLYGSLGFEIAGVVPGFARDPFAEKFDATTYMFKHLKPDHS
uniref:GNAT family N-acetyltransferase n=1 Tax=Pararhizobium sp. IMCC3301 TaxID=3067904 RepID=UPI002741311C|nr:GNAT family N-acetyltransferase [Pararhizobium sp. IMCC3301]